MHTWFPLLLALSTLLTSAFGDNTTAGWTVQPSGAINVVLDNATATRLEQILVGDGDKCSLKKRDGGSSATCIWTKAISFFGDPILLKLLWDAAKVISQQSPNFQLPNWKADEQAEAFSLTLTTAGAALPLALDGATVQEMEILSSIVTAAVIFRGFESFTGQTLGNFNINTDFTHGGPFKCSCMNPDCKNPMCNGINSACSADGIMRGCSCQVAHCPPPDDLDNILDCDDLDCNDVWRDELPPVCMKDAHKNCPCITVLQAWVDYSDPIAITNAVALLNSISSGPQKDKIGGLGCYGLGSPKFMAADEADHIDEFCGSKPMNSGRPGPVIEAFRKHYNINSDNEVIFEISYPKNTYVGSDDHISVNDCRSLLRMILDGCDGNDPDNPTNLKHGGWASYTWDTDNPNEKAWFSIKPQQNRGNPTCFTSSFGRWVNARNGTSAAADFCQNTLYDTARPKGTRVTKDFFVDTTRLTLTARWFDNWSLGPNDCLDAFTKIFDGCDSSSSNPENLKFGGQVLTGGASNSEVLFVAIPQVSLAFPIDVPFSIRACTKMPRPPNYSGVMGKYQMLKAVNDYCVRYKGMESPPIMQADGGTGQLCLPGGIPCLQTSGPEHNSKGPNYDDIKITVTPVAECDHPKLSVNECKETMANFAFQCNPSPGACYKDQVVADYMDCPADQYAFGGSVRKNCFDYTVDYF